MEKATTRILLVEDEQRVAESMRDLLNLYGFSAATAPGVREAVDHLNREPCDIVLLDLNLRGKKCWQLLDFIVAGHADAAVIVVSGETSPADGAQAMRRGASNYLQKSFSPEQLVQAIRTALRQRHVQKDNAATQSRLIESEKLHRYMVESSPDLIYMLDRNGRFSFVNERIEALLGYRKSELLGVHYSTLIHEPDLEFARRIVDERRTGERAPRNVELRLKCRDETVGRGHRRFRPVEISAMGMYRPGDAPAAERFEGTYGIARDISDRKHAEEIVNFQASHDSLTRLPTRFLFNDRLALAISQAHRSPQTLAIMFLDLDRFKSVNDTLGHSVGDRLLQEVSARILGCLREGDTLARTGGDEFMLLLPRAGRANAAAEVARKILTELRRSFTIGEHDLFVTISIGIALYPEHGSTPDMLVRRADTAMYEAKTRGNDAYAFYRDGDGTAIADHLELERDMRRALQAGQFLNYYQPQINVATGEIAGVEALVRWRHPTRGLLRPAEFIPVAEESGLVVELGEWVLRRACADIAEWRGGNGPVPRLAVNFSVLQLEQAELVEKVASILDEYGLASDALVIEITENMAMRKADNTLDKLRELSRRGIRIAIDDFGTGRASLSYLRRLPIDILKLGHSVVRDIRTAGSDTSISSVIASMANSLDLSLIAGGVETELQMNYLRSIGCNEMQGFMLSPPLKADAASRFVKRKPASLTVLR